MVVPTLAQWSTGLTVILLGAVTYTDLRSRRIPNYLTFPALGLGLILSGLARGWEGLLLSVVGAFVAPAVLSLAHGGRGLGMGDLKLAAAVGALLGPALALVAMVLSMVAGGLVALLWMGREWGMFGHGRVGSAVRKLLPGGGPTADNKKTGAMTVPYGLAIALGTLFTLVVCLWTGKANWFWSALVGGTP